MNFEQFQGLMETALAGIRKVIIGQEEAVRYSLVAVLCNQHALIEGVPGLGKTLLARTLAAALGSEFKRIQFTPDLMPADITGTNVFNLQRNEFVMVQGPLFTTFLLADEINARWRKPNRRRETTETIARGKTVSLIRLTLVLPAMLGGASARELQLLERIALYWGLAYQMVDDLKDLLDSEANAGKTVARDLALDRPNSASAMGIPAAVQRLTRFIELGDKALTRLLQSRLGFSFLGKLRSSLEDEVARVTGHPREMHAGARE